MSEKDNDSKITLSRRRALAGLGTIGVAGALGVGGTYAQFSDTEEKTVTFSAGGLDGSLTWSGSYNGNAVSDGLEHVSVGDISTTPEGVTADVHFEDIKPGDFGCVNFGIEVTNNPAWVASCLNVQSDVDGTVYEPEVEADGDLSDTQMGKQNIGSDGELAENIYTIPYYDSDGSCTFFDPDGNVNFDPASYSGANPSPFWSNSQSSGGINPSAGGSGPISVSDADDTEYLLTARSLQDVSQNIRAVDTAHWNGADDTLNVQTAPDGASVGAGCVMLDGAGSENSTNNTQGVAPLAPGDTLNFGYDFHMPFGVGNEAQGDQLTLKLGFTFLQTRHTTAPQFDSYDPGQNTPNNSS